MIDACVESMVEGNLIEFTVEKLAFGGKGLSRVGGMVVFVERGLPGDRVRARVTRVKKRFAEAKVVDVLAPSEHRVVAPCPDFGICGGCQWQDLAYEQQLEWKRTHVAEALRHLGKVDQAQAMALVAPTMASPLVYGYRNKMEFAFAAAPGEPARLGLRSWTEEDAGNADEGQPIKAVVEVADCRLMAAPAMDIVREVRAFCAQSGVAAHDPASGKGYWRFFVLRRTEDETGRVRTLAHLITTDDESKASLVATLAERLRARFPEIVGLVHSLRQGKAQLAFGERVRAVYGEANLPMRLGDIDYAISANGFFQTNTLAAQALYETTRQYCALTGKETVWDLYCGSGGLGLYLAKEAAQIVGFDNNPEAANDAGRTAAGAGIAHAAFRVGDLRALLKREKTRPDVVVADPPRAGLHPEVAAAILKRAPARVVCVSCNPAALARDLAVFLPHYTLVAVQPVDLFPHTPHIECVALLERRD